MSNSRKQHSKKQTQGSSTSKPQSQKAQPTSSTKDEPTQLSSTTAAKKEFHSSELTGAKGAQPLFFIRTLLNEYNLWLAIAILVTGRIWLKAIAYSFSPSIIYEAITNYYFEFLLGICLLLFPIIFTKIFGKPPLEMISLSKNKKTTDITLSDKKTSMGVQEPTESLHIASDTTCTSLSVQDMFISYESSSTTIATGVYNRAGAYLFIGMIIAFLGLAVFYYLVSTAIKFQTLEDNLLSFAPRFGIMFFIEFIAFFFLKQYRVSMDEFKYYEAIKMTCPGLFGPSET